MGIYQGKRFPATGLSKGDLFRNSDTKQWYVYQGGDPLLLSSWKTIEEDFGIPDLGEGSKNVTFTADSDSIISVTGGGSIPGGGGDVTGPVSSANNAIVRFDGATGKSIKNSTVTLDDSNVLSTDALSNISIKIPLQTPTGVTAVATTGGTLAPGTYYYRVAARSNDYSAASPEVSVVVDGTNNAVQISWTGVPGANYYYIYGRTSGAQDMSWFVDRFTLSYTDTGTAGTPDTPPVVTLGFSTDFSPSLPSDPTAAVLILNRDKMSIGGYPLRGGIGLEVITPSLTSSLLSIVGQIESELILYNYNNGIPQEYAFWHRNNHKLSLVDETNAREVLTIDPTYGESLGIGVPVPTAVLHLKGGTATANTAPFKLTAGVNLTSPEAGAIEYDGIYLTYTNSTPIRKKLQSTDFLTAPSNIVVGASPFVYQNTTIYPADVIVSGGTVSEIAFSRDNVTYYVIGTTAGMFQLSPNDYLRVTYTAAPTMTLVPR